MNAAHARRELMCGANGLASLAIAVIPGLVRRAWKKTFARVASTWLKKLYNSLRHMNGAGGGEEKWLSWLSSKKKKNDSNV